MGKFAIFAFNGNPMCFVHVMLNALDLDGKGHEVKVILEGEAVMMIKEMREKENKLFALLEQKNRIDCVCKACSFKMGILEYNEESGIRLADEMTGHPAMGTYVEEGYTIISM